jgi:ATP-dependent Clp protease adaptor protein ClpS
MSDTDRSATVKVLLLNDDETIMELVVHVLEGVFGKTRDEALKLVLMIDRDGRGECGVYTAEQASNIVSSRTGQTQWLSSALCYRAQLKGLI